MVDTKTKYYFNGPFDLVENAKTIKYLGYFVEHVGIPFSADWLYDAKAKFEYGTVSKGHYDKIVKIDDTETETDTIFSYFEYIYNSLMGIREKTT